MVATVPSLFQVDGLEQQSSGTMSTHTPQVTSHPFDVQLRKSMKTMQV